MEEDVLLSVAKNLGNIHKYDYVDVPEILRFALNDKMIVVMYFTHPLPPL